MGVLYARVGGVWQAVNYSTSDRWNTAWGVVAQGQSTSGGQTITNNQTVDLAGLSVTFTPVAGRCYRTSASVMVLPSVSGAMTVDIYDGSTVRQQRNVSSNINGYFALDIDVVESGLPAVSTLRKARLGLSNSSGNVQTVVGTSYPAYLTVEDVGPVAGAIAIPNPTPAWIPVASFVNGWGNIGSGYSPAMYRRVGDKVEVRGGLSCPTPITAPNYVIAFVLPAGFRPPYTASSSAISGGADSWSGGGGYVQVFTDGSFAVFKTVSTPANPHTFTGFEFSFSVTP